MLRPPLFALVGALLLTSTAVGPAVAAPSDTTVETTDSAIPTAVDPCEDPVYTGHDLGFESNETYADALENGSLPDWTSGDIVHVGAGGGCSLVVADGQTSTLEATTVDGTDGVVTGTLDLGTNGSVRLVESNSTNATAPVVRLSNVGNDYSTVVRVAAGGESRNLSLSSGRFFEFGVVTGENQSVRVAVWPAERPWRGEWDARIENASVDSDLRLQLTGRAFLDGIATGTVPEPDTTGPQGETGDPAAESPDDEDDSVADDPFDDADPGAPPNDGGNDSTGEYTFLGLLMVVGGVVGFRFAYGFTKFSEQLDAIGSKTRAGEVEPAEWNVMLTKVASAIIAVIGLGMLASALV